MMQVLSHALSTYQLASGKNNEVSRLSRQCFSVIEAGNEALADLIFLEVCESQIKTLNFLTSCSLIAYLGLKSGI